MIQFLFEQINPKEISEKTKLKKWLKSFAQEKGCSIGELTYIFCDEEKMLEINQQYLQHDEHTDIITFDYVDCEKPSKLSGDIFISIPRVQENAKIFNTSTQNELLRVMSHGLFHLMGFKDKTPEETANMRAAEDWAVNHWQTFE